MIKTQIAKQIVSTVIGIGTTKIVNAIITNNIALNQVKVTDKVAIIGAGVVIGSMAADKTKEYTDAKIDEAITWWKKNITKA